MNVELHQLDLRYEKLRTHKPEAERKLVGSLAAIGQQVPVVVVHGEGPERFVLVDGYKRVRALRRLGQDLVGATCWDLSEAEALVLDRLMRTGEGATALEQGWLLHELAVRFKLSLDDLGRRFARSASWVSRRLALVEELPAAIQEHVRRGELPAHAAMKYLVPLARANGVACARLVTAIAGKGLTNRQIGQLYAAWREGLPAIGGTPVLMRVVTACTACHRIGAGKGDGSGVIRLVAGIDRPTVPGPEVGELLGREDVAPAAPIPFPHLLADDRQRVQESGEPTGALQPVPPRAGPEGLEQLGRRRRVADLRPERLQRLQQPGRGPGLGVGVAAGSRGHGPGPGARGCGSRRPRRRRPG